MPVIRAEGIRADGWSFLLSDPSAARTDPSDYDRTLQIAEETTRALGGAPVASQWIPIDKGWGGKLSSVTELDGAVTWLEMFADRWSDGAVVQPRPRDRFSRHRDPSPALTLGLAYSTEDLSRLPREDRGRVWAVPPDVTREVVHRVLAWLDVDGATTFYHHTPWSTPTIGQPPLESLVEAILEVNASTNLQSMRTKPVRHRGVEFEREGRVACQDVDSTRSARDQLELLVECVRWQPAALDYAFMAFAHGGLVNVWTGDYAHYDLPNGLRESHLRQHRALLSSYVPDVFGGQVLTDAHLERAHDLGNWVVEEIAPGRHLVTAQDLDPWLATPPPHHQNAYRLSAPPADLIDKARADFGDMLLTQQVMQRLTADDLT